MRLLLLLLAGSASLLLAQVKAPEPYNPTYPTEIYDQEVEIEAVEGVGPIEIRSIPNRPDYHQPGLYHAHDQAVEVEAVEGKGPVDLRPRDAMLKEETIGKEKVEEAPSQPIPPPVQSIKLNTATEESQSKTQPTPKPSKSNRAIKIRSRRSGKSACKPRCWSSNTKWLPKQKITQPGIENGNGKQKRCSLEANQRAPKKQARRRTSRPS